jgi:hypothetical protein
MVGNSITVTKIPSASVPSTQSAKAETSGMLEVKVPTSQMKQATSPPTAAPAKPAMSPTVNNTVFYNAINDEVVHFGSELAALRSRVNGISVQVSNIIMHAPILRFVCFTMLLPVFSTSPSSILISLHQVGFEVSTAVVMKGIIFWDMTPCSLLATCLLAGSC